MILPEIVPPTKEEVSLSEEGGAHLTEAAVTAGTFEAVLVPVLFQGLQEEPVRDGLLTSRTVLLRRHANRFLGNLNRAWR